MLSFLLFALSGLRIQHSRYESIYLFLTISKGPFVLFLFYIETTVQLILIQLCLNVQKVYCLLDQQSLLHHFQGGAGTFLHPITSPSLREPEPDGVVDY
jgi:hypothetical protein